MDARDYNEFSRAKDAKNILFHITKPGCSKEIMKRGYDTIDALNRGECRQPGDSSKLNRSS